MKAEGALSTAFIPVFTDYLATRPRVEFNRMLRAVAGGLLLTLCAVSAVGALLAPWLVAVMAPGFSAVPEQLRLATTLTRLMFPYLIFVGLAALAMGVLNAHRRFFPSALGPAPAAGPPGAGPGQFATQLPEVRAAGAPLRPSAEFSHPALGRIARLLGPTVFGLAAVQLNVFVNTLLASLLPGGSISFLYYADRVVEFPLGVFGIAVASASLPVMAEQAARRDLGGLGAREDFALGLTAFAAVRIAAQAFYALGDTRTPVKAGIAAVGLNVAVAVALMGPLRHGGPAVAAPPARGPH